MKRFATLSLALSATVASFSVVSTTAVAHERAFPSKQLKALAASNDFTFKEGEAKPMKEALASFEQKHGFSYSKGELAGPIYLGSDKDKKIKVVAVFLDGKSDSGDTEFGATVTTAGKIDNVAVYSSPESSEATSQEFLKSLNGKSADELDALKKALTEKEKSKKFIVELAQKAIGRVEASFKKK